MSWVLNLLHKPCSLQWTILQIPFTAKEAASTARPSRDGIGGLVPRPQLDNVQLLHTVAEVSWNTVERLHEAVVSCAWPGFTNCPELNDSNHRNSTNVGVCRNAAVPSGRPLRCLCNGEFPWPLCASCGPASPGQEGIATPHARPDALGHVQDML